MRYLKKCGIKYSKGKGENMEKTREIYFDILKIVASFLVVFNHTGGNGFSLFITYEPNRIKFWICLCMAILCKVAVPLFLTVSGALLLPKVEEDIKDIWKKRIGKMFMVLFVFSFVSYSWDVIENGREFSIREFLQGIYSSQWNYAYWYLYAYIGFLICLPILRAIVRTFETKEYLYLFGIATVLSGVIPVMEFLLGLNVELNRNLNIFGLTNSIFVYPLLGYFLQYKLEKIYDLKGLLKLWLVNIVGIVIVMLVTAVGIKRGVFVDEDTTQRFFEAFALLNCAVIFVTVKSMATKRRIVKLERMISMIGKCTFGIYLIHPILMWQALDHVNFCGFFIKEWNLDFIPAGVLFAAIIWLISLVITMVVKKIPYIGSII